MYKEMKRTYIKPEITVDEMMCSEILCSSDTTMQKIDDSNSYVNDVEDLL